MRKGLLVLSLFSIFFFTYAGVAFALIDIAKVTIKVVDEGGKPIEAARVGIGFEYNQNWGTKETGRASLSDSQGLFTASASTNGHIGWNITKDGYYKTIGSYDFQEYGHLGWKPWNPTLEVVLRKIVNPVPMYARDTRRSRVEIPVAGTDIAFDLIEFDWLNPYGRGTTADLLFHLDLMDNGGDDFEYKLKVSFTNTFDGAVEIYENIRQGSVFKLPRVAPVNGYDKEIEVYFVGLKRGSKVSWKDDRHYIFRVRSEEENGQLKRAMYGKILSDIKLSSAKKKGGMPSIEFKYYLNPNYTRNLEFDPKQNLFGNLPDLERVNEP
jgi:hypothetical protein